MITLEKMIRQKYVLLIGIDGVRQDAFIQAINDVEKDTAYAYFNEAMQKGKKNYLLYAGGDEENRQPTLSASGWTTILTGVWAKQHNIWENPKGDPYEYYNEHYNSKIPTIFNTLHEYNTSSLSDWNALGALSDRKCNGHNGASTIINYSSETLDDYVKNDQRLTDEAIRIFTSSSASIPRFTFLYYGQADAAGHSYDFSTKNSQYMSALKTILANINVVLEKVDKRRPNEQWLIIFTTDHGGSHATHGSQAWTDREIFAVLYDPQSVKYSDGGFINTFQGQTAIVPSILEYLNISYDTQLLAGRPLGDVDIPYHSLYLQYDLNADRLMDAYPLSVTKHWPGISDLQAKNIVAALLKGDKTAYYFFLNDGTYLCYDVAVKRLDPELPLPVAEHWHGIGSYRHFISAAMNHAKDSTKAYYFLSALRVL